MQQTKTARLQYIDAMRGIAVVLIVFGHMWFAYGDYHSFFSFRDITGMLRLPILFFVSGFVFTSKPLGWCSGGGISSLKRYANYYYRR